MSRQFTDGEIGAAIKALAAEGVALTRASVRKRLGGGGSTRISALLKEYADSSAGSLDRSGPVASNGPVRTGPASLVTLPGDGKATRGAAHSPSAVTAASSAVQPAGEDREPEGSIARLQSEVRVLKILLESERNARREEEARHTRTIEALQREIEIASRG
ncbi:hypothetical protein [Bradyrhizobium sp. CCBAU 53380]|uniref:hypothetical protein n=1 Tax=Bradyrhizobium sp. CCBAU 53380 TaxID=1325117 RepID=UPI0023048411|nr:hypothetical protein [Bradyrhizobium sp. CCBAU 53380]MDA9422915.1 hypothetical protein [Bradyrhizobium sp. CCBAU 53380]